MGLVVAEHHARVMSRSSVNRGFFDVPRHRAVVSAGEVELPILYTDASATTVFYSVNFERARSLLAPHGLAPARSPRRGALLAITWFEYRSTSIGSYNELGISLLAAPGRRAPVLPLLRVLTGDARVGFFVLHLPVTTEIARAGGVELYGYPKTVAELPISVDSDVVEGAMVDAGERVLSMRIPLRMGLEVPMIDLVTYSVLGGHLMRTVVPTDCRARVFRSRDATLHVTAPDHPIGRTLQELAPSGKPAGVLHVAKFRSRLPWPELVC